MFKLLVILFVVVNTCLRAVLILSTFVKEFHLLKSSCDFFEICFRCFSKVFESLQEQKPLIIQSLVIQIGVILFSKFEYWGNYHLYLCHYIKRQLGEIRNLTIFIYLR